MTSTLIHPPLLLTFLLLKILQTLKVLQTLKILVNLESAKGNLLVFCPREWAPDFKACVCTTQEAQAIADEYGKTLVLIVATTGLTTKATWAESVWNIHWAWYASTNPKLSNKSMNDYCSHQMKHYESHKDEGEHPELWVKIQKFWNESINSTKDMSLKVMAQTWSNVEGIHVFRCVIYSGNDKAAHQAQGVFAGSLLCMQLASKRQTDVAKLLDFLSMIIK
ncbi:hypothetical protein F5J12DRAFT_781679 [Pisolithus orientalis]|uniref:uncharacterized protein n=1 Tax=Pisolithus orientalis TaxID=936130 RepID=UPI002225996C|nr:uncharacterized protein F5J12DRAFT_781679 [Pisolithus orientalis]KAI6010660.1 hypothetical protein F5J12DRAFT_781679 [Pisolithus orientalis]